jgi:hypothetical protein
MYSLESAGSAHSGGNTTDDNEMFLYIMAYPLL